MSIFAQQDPAAEPLCVFGPRSGYSPQIGVFVSQLNWMRRVVLSRLQNLSVEELDWLPYPSANSIGALLIHLAATEVYYGLNTFDGVAWGRFPYDMRKKWGVAMGLGQTARFRYKGFDLEYYRSHLAAVRENTLSQLSHRDDEWLMAVDATWGWGPTNNLCKWFHVCEHESHHLGQIDLILKQLPGRQHSDKRSLQRGQASRTALGAALRRAAHQIYDAGPLVLNDPLAVALLKNRYAQFLEDAREDLDDKEFNRRYFAGRTDRLNLQGRSGHMIAAYRKPSRT